jgi:hypothetical protein
MNVANFGCTGIDACAVLFSCICTVKDDCIIFLLLYMARTVDMFINVVRSHVVITRR